MLKIIVQLILFLFPWFIRKYCLSTLFGFKLEKGTHMGYTIILAKEVHLKEYATIGHLNFCKSIDKLELGPYSGIGNRNFITGFSVTDPIVTIHGHFNQRKDRKCELIIGEHVGITSRHYFDCNGGVHIGDFCQIAGFETAFLSHSIDLNSNRQDAETIKIGKYSFIGTRVTILKGSEIPSYSVIGACSMVNKKLETPYCLYGGVPCKFIKEIKDYKFFQRKEGFVK